MHTHSGKQFFPLDPRPEDICIDDIANGLALDCRYAGQGRVDRFYSVAEHSWHMASYVFVRLAWPRVACLATLMHDAAEAYVNDLPRAAKAAVGQGYKDLENNIGNVIAAKYQYDLVEPHRLFEIKEFDRRIVPLEKAAIMAVDQPWNHDQFEPLPLTEIQCWEPERAKLEFLHMFHTLYMGEEE